jgi:hypothetical protein
MDELCHASIRDGIQLSKTPKAYNSITMIFEDLERLILRNLIPIFISSLNLFSMDGGLSKSRRIGFALANTIVILLLMKRMLCVFLVHQMDSSSNAGVARSFARIMTSGKVWDVMEPRF